jgi:hypothetical protein
MPTDQEIVDWEKSGSIELFAKAITYLFGLPELNRCIRNRCRKSLEERQILDPDQACYSADAEEVALLWIFERAFSRKTCRSLYWAGKVTVDSISAKIDW